MRRRPVLIAAAAFSLLAIAAASAQAPPATIGGGVPPPGPGAGTATPPITGAKTMLPVKDLMRHVVNPAAEAYWQAGGEVDEGEKRNLRTPTDDAKWTGAEDAASVILESGNLLLMQGRAHPDPEWMKWAQDLIEAGQAGIKAARARDGEATFAAGSQMYDACYNCHGRYVNRGRRETPKPLPELPGDEKPKSLR